MLNTIFALEAHWNVWCNGERANTFGQIDMKQLQSGLLTPESYIPLYDSAHRQNLLVRRPAYLNPRFDIACMYNITAANIHCHMSFIADQIAGLRILIADLRAGAPLLVRGAGYCISEISINAVGKTGTVRPVRQAGAAGYIGIAYILTSIACNLFAQVAAARPVNNIRNRS